MTLSGFGVAMISCLLTYDGWVALSFVAGEVKEPKRNLPLALALGVGLAIAIYVLANVAYLRVLTRARDRGHGARRRTGRGAHHGHGRRRIRLLHDSDVDHRRHQRLVMTAPRIYFAQARDGLFFRRFAAIHPRFQTPYVSILMFGAWSALLALTGTYETLASYAMFAAWVF